MLIRLLYISRAAVAMTTTVTGSILESARLHNRVAGISGVLCQGQGLYIQVLEGERLAGALAQADTARLLDYLLESGGIYVE